jgi:hypothetical protein
MVTGRSAQPKAEQHRVNQHGAAQSANPVTVITDARPGASEELWRRQKRYMITMAFRTACFISMVFVSGWLRWVLFACALFLPYVAVVFANQADRKGIAAERVEPGEPGAMPQLTVGKERIAPGEQDVEGEPSDAEHAPDADPSTAEGRNVDSPTDAGPADGRRVA